MTAPAMKHRGAWTIIALLLIIGLVVSRSRYIRLDRQLHPASLPGLYGLCLYLTGQYRAAASAYRHEMAQLVIEGDTAETHVYDALLEGDVEMARFLASDWIGRESLTIDQRLDLGELALAAGDDQEAQRRFDQVLSQDAQQFDALLLTAIVFTRRRENARAIEWINRALRTNTTETRWTTFLIALETLGDLSHSPVAERSPCLLAHYHRYLRIADPYHAHLARGYAVEAIRQQDHPDDAYLTLGILEEKRHRWTRALHYFSQAIAYNPRHAEALRWAASVHGERGELLKEYEMIRAAYEAAPEDPVYLAYWDYVLRKKLGDLQPLLTIYQERLAHDPDNAQLLDRLGGLHASLGDHEQAITLFRAALAHDPVNGWLYKEMAFSLSRLKRDQEAMAALQTALALDPKDWDAHQRLASIYQNQHRYQDAINAYEEAITLGDNDPNDRAALCAMYHATSKFQQAVVCFERVLRQDPRNTLAQRLISESRNNLHLQQTQQSVEAPR